jgi:hypothetical protein
MSGFKVGMTVNANIKYAGDVPLPGIFLYIYNITASGSQTSQISPWVWVAVATGLVIIASIILLEFNRSKRKTKATS